MPSRAAKARGTTRCALFLAFAAFLLSLGSVFYQLAVFLRGADVMLATPRQVAALLLPVPDSDERYLALATTLAYVNDGAPGQDDVVVEETVTFELDGEAYRYDWHEFVTLGFGIGTGAPTSRVTLEVTDERTAAPFVVPGGGAAAHETLFAARFDPEFIDAVEVERGFRAALGGASLEWPLRFQAMTLAGETEPAHCVVTMTPKLAGQLLSRKQGWVLLNCRR